MGFYILLAVAALLSAAVLELSKNVIAGWLVLAALCVLFAALRLSMMKDGRWGKGPLLICWLAFILLIAGNIYATQPPVRLKPAVSGKSAGADPRIVQVEQGALQGVLTKDGQVSVFAGIPYAAPPVGDLRWKEPQAPESWEGVRLCESFGPMAMQKRNLVIYDSLVSLLGTHDYIVSLKDNFREMVSEDCLYLNVWRPADTGNELLPVLFFIHGGSLMTGQSSYEAYNGESFARQGIIVVNCAYRLGVFGYYANEELAAESPNGTTGDYGLLDQIAALRWVHDNIAAFGGDPEKITIAGESAGSSSVNAICASPLSEGLFRYAIAESSSVNVKKPYHTFRTPEAAYKMGRDVMAEFGASGIADLRAVPAEKLVQTKYDNSSMTVDGYALPEQPYLTYERGANHEQALLNGFNAKEADAFTLPYKVTADNYVELLSRIAGDHAEELAAAVPAGSVTRDQKFFIDAGGEAKGSFNHAFSAAWFTYSHHVWSRYMLAQGRPVYEYYFTKSNNCLSNYHAGEMPYAYGNLWRKAKLYDEADFEVSRLMQSYWVNFVKTGDPNGEGLPRWDAREEGSELLMEFCAEPKMTEDPYLAIYEILDKYQDEAAEKAE